MIIILSLHYKSVHFPPIWLESFCRCTNGIIVMIAYRLPEHPLKIDLTTPQTASRASIYSFHFDEVVLCFLCRCSQCYWFSDTTEWNGLIFWISIRRYVWCDWLARQRHNLIDIYRSKVHKAWMMWPFFFNTLCLCVCVAEFVPLNVHWLCSCGKS